MLDNKSSKPEHALKCLIIYYYRFFQQGFHSTPEPSHVVFDFIMDQPNFPPTHGVHAATGVVGTQVVRGPKIVRELMDEGIDLGDKNRYDIYLVHDS